MSTYTKDQIKTKLSTDIRWMERALIVLFNRQTFEEQDSGSTHVYNNRGFTGSDARYLTYISKWLMSDSRNHLSGKHLEKCKKILPKYWRQIKDEIDGKRG
jgi:hypothetical protein